jgi:aldehyde:ferredoxin oxidoreductase
MRPIYAEVNLNTRTWSKVIIPKELYEQYLGGKALGSKLLYDLMSPGVDPLSEDNVFIVNTGPLTGTGAPSTSRFNISTKNVMTGGIATSNCGGTFGIKLKKAGFDGLIIKGKASSPVFLEVLDGAIEIKDATDLWGLDTEETQERFDSSYGKLVIGQAGENLVKYASAASGERVAGRTGVGAVMGSKNLKAIVAFGTKKVALDNEMKFKNYVKKWTRFIKNHPMTGQQLSMFGTAGLVNKTNASGMLPTLNFKFGSWDKAEAISGEALREKHLTRNSGCISCPIRCERRVLFDGKEIKGPEYETLALFGSNLGIDDLQSIIEWNYYCDKYGMDTISLAVTLSYAMELQKNRIKDFGVSFGEKDAIKDVIGKIAMREGIYSELANGSKILSEKYGGKEYAIHAKGLELAAYDPRKAVGMGLGYATSNRGACHLDGGYLASIEIGGSLPVPPTKTKGKAELCIFFQNLSDAVSSAGFCLFTSQTFIPKLLYKLNPSGKAAGMIGNSMLTSRHMLGFLLNHPRLLSMNSMSLVPHAACIKYATGLKINTGKMLEIGDRNYNIERMFNVREGFASKDDMLPARLTEDLLEEKNPTTRVRLREMLHDYYKVRGWDKDGIPTVQKLKKIKI